MWSRTRYVRRLPVALLAPTLLVAAACSGQDSGSTSNTVASGTTIDANVAPGALDYAAYSDPGQPIYVALARRFALKLESDPGGGFSWQVANQPSRDVVVPLGTQLRSDDPGVPGSSATQYINFAASGIGTTTITVHYVAPNGDVAPEPAPITFTVTVTFTGDPPPAPPPPPGTQPGR